MDNKEAVATLTESVVKAVCDHVEAIGSPRPNRVIAMAFAWDDEYDPEGALRAFILAGPGDLKEHSQALAVGRMFGSILKGLHAADETLRQGPVVDLAGPVH